MNIVYDEEYKSFHLYNEKISYVMKIEKNCYLSHCYFGKRIRRWNEAAKMYYYDRGFCANPDETDRTFSLDTMPGEYPDFGQGFSKSGNGVRISGWRQKYKIPLRRIPD